MRRALALAICLAVLLGGAGVAEEADVAPSYEGRWVSVRDSAMEIYLPTGWKVASKQAVPVGLLAEDEASGLVMRLSLSPSEEMTVEALCELLAADARYANCRIAEFGALDFVLMDDVETGGYMGVSDYAYVGMVFTFVFSPCDTDTMRGLAREVMGTLRYRKDNNG